MLKIKTMLVVFSLMMLMPLNLFATSKSTNTINSLSDNSISGGTRSDISVTNENYNPDIELPKTDTKTANGYIEKKGMDIVHVVQTAAIIICVIVFIIGLILTAVGGLSHSGLMFKGLIVCLITAIVFVAVQFALPLLIHFQNWATNY